MNRNRWDSSAPSGFQSQFWRELLRKAFHLDADELDPLFQLADEEYSRIAALGNEYFSLVVNPSFVQTDDAEVDSVMAKLDSRKEPSGSWLPVVVERNGKLYRVWGKTSYCG